MKTKNRTVYYISNCARNLPACWRFL